MFKFLPYQESVILLLGGDAVVKWGIVGVENGDVLFFCVKGRH